MTFATIDNQTRTQIATPIGYRNTGELGMSFGSTMGQMRNWFLQGIALVAPLVITIALLVWIGRSVELVIGDFLRHLLPVDWYIPGMGLAVGALGTLAVGLLANLFLVRWLVLLGERVVDRIPLVKSLFQGLKDVARLFTRSGDQELGRAVAVEIEGMQLVGFVMQERAQLPARGGDQAEQLVAVYLPMSYQVGGYTLYLTRDRVRPLDIPPDDAMRAVFTGGSLIGTRSAVATPDRRGPSTATGQGSSTPGKRS